mgnify:CR=1 FL=1
MFVYIYKKYTLIDLSFRKLLTARRTGLSMFYRGLEVRLQGLGAGCPCLGREPPRLGGQAPKRWALTPRALAGRCPCLYRLEVPLGQCGRASCRCSDPSSASSGAWNGHRMLSEPPACPAASPACPPNMGVAGPRLFPFGRFPMENVFGFCWGGFCTRCAEGGGRGGIRGMPEGPRGEDGNIPRATPAEASSKVRLRGFLSRLTQN